MTTMLSWYLDSPIPEGERNGALFRATMVAREHGWDENEVRNVLGDKARRDGLTSHEIDGTIRSAYQRALDPTRKTKTESYTHLRAVGGSGWGSGWDIIIEASHEESPSPPPQTSWRDAVKWLEHMFGPDEIVAYNAQFSEDNGKYIPKGWGRYTSTRAQLCAAIARSEGGVLGQDSPAGAWVRLNPMDGGGVCDANVKAYRHCLLEFDDRSPQEQQAIVQRLKIPCASIVHSGGKSVHFAVKIHAPTLEEYRRRVSVLYDVVTREGCAPDRQNRNPSRLSRIPGVMRGGKPQYLIALNAGLPSWEEWESFIAQKPEEEPSSLAATIESMTDWYPNPPPLAPELIHGILRRGHKLLLSGASKGGKTFALLDLARAISSGASWLGIPCAQGRVLYVNCEVDKASFCHRMMAVHGINPFEPANMHTLHLRGEICTLDVLAVHLQKSVAAGSYDAIILDPLYKLLTGDENSASEMAQFCRHLDKIAVSTGAAVIICSHFSKGMQGGKSSIDRTSGSGVFGRDPDAIGTITETDMEGVVELEWTLRDFARPKPVALLWQYPCYSVAPRCVLEQVSVPGNKGKEKPKAERKEQKNAAWRDKLIAAIYECGGGVAQAPLKEIAEHMNVSKDTVRRNTKSDPAIRIAESVVYYLEDQDEREDEWK